MKIKQNVEYFHNNDDDDDNNNDYDNNNNNNDKRIVAVCRSVCLSVQWDYVPPVAVWMQLQAYGLVQNGDSA